MALGQPPTVIQRRRLFLWRIKMRSIQKARELIKIARVGVGTGRFKWNYLVRDLINPPEGSSPYYKMGISEARKAISEVKRLFQGQEKPWDEFTVTDLLVEAYKDAREKGIVKVTIKEEDGEKHKTIKNVKAFSKSIMFLFANLVGFDAIRTRLSELVRSMEGAAKRKINRKTTNVGINDEETYQKKLLNDVGLKLLGIGTGEKYTVDNTPVGSGGVGTQVDFTLTGRDNFIKKLRELVEENERQNAAEMTRTRLLRKIPSLKTALEAYGITDEEIGLVPEIGGITEKELAERMMTQSPQKSTTEFDGKVECSNPNCDNRFKVPDNYQGKYPHCWECRKKRIGQARTQIRIAQSLLNEPERSPEVIFLLQKALKAEFQQWDLYYAYKDELKGLARDSVANHFDEHAADEAEHIEILQRYLVSMGIQPTKERETIPEIDAMRMEPIVELQNKFEKQAIETYQQLLDVIEDKDPLRIEVENILAKEQEHSHDLERLLIKNSKKKLDPESFVRGEK